MTILHVVPKFVGLADDEYQASFYVETDLPVGLGDEGEVSDDLTDWLQDMFDNIAGQVRNVITAIEYAVFIYDLVTDTYTFFFDGGWTFTGTNSAAESFPPQMAATITAPVIGGGRPGQKRVIPFVETMANAGVLVAGAITNLLALGNRWVDPFAGAVSLNYTPGIVSRPEGAAPSFKAFTGAVFVREQLGTMRKRKPGVGG